MNIIELEQKWGEDILNGPIPHGLGHHNLDYGIDPGKLDFLEKAFEFAGIANPFQTVKDFVANLRSNGEVYDEY